MLLKKNYTKRENIASVLGVEKLEWKDPNCPLTRWRMIVKRVKTGGDRGWDSLDKDLSDSPMDPLIHLQPNTFPSPNTIKSSILVLWGVIMDFCGH